MTQVTSHGGHLLRRVARIAAAVWGVLGAAGTVWAQAPVQPPMGGSNSAELGLVVASGNARSTTIGFRNVYTYRWPSAELGWESGWLRAASRDGNRFVVLYDTADVDVVEPDTAVDSSRLFSKLRYQRQFSVHHDWFTNLDAVRDEPANISRQFVVAAGLGTTWIKSDRVMFRTAYGFSYTNEDLVIEGENDFGGYRLFYGLKVPVAAAATYDSELTIDGSFDTGEDIRADSLNSISVALNTRMTLRSSLRTLFRNLPALQFVDVVSPDGERLGTVELPNDRVDLGFTTSLGITF